MTVEEIVKELRLAVVQSNMTINEISMRSGVGYSTLDNWMYYGIPPRLERLIKEAEVVGLEIIIRKVGEAQDPEKADPAKADPEPAAKPYFRHGLPSCGSCGLQIHKGNKYCPWCGKRVGWDD